MRFRSRAQPDWAYEFPDRTGPSKFAKQVLPDWTISGLIFLDILHITKEQNFIEIHQIETFSLLSKNIFF